MVTYLGSLVQLCCGEGRTLQTDITGVCGECSQCLGHTGFATAHGMCSFPVYTAQHLGCSAGELSKAGPGCVPFPGLTRSGSGSRSSTKAQMVGPAFCALPRSKQLREPGALRAHAPQVGGASYHLPVPAAWFPGWQQVCPSQVCRVSLLGS